MREWREEAKVMIYALIVPSFVGFVLSCLLSCGWTQQPNETDAQYQKRRADRAESARATAEEAAKVAAPFLPPPFNYVATLAAGLLGEYGRKTITRRVRRGRRSRKKATVAPAP